MARYHSNLAFPLLDSYPSIFRDAGGVSTTERTPLRLAISTNSSVTDKVKGLRSTVLRSIGLEDREDIGDQLAEIAETYKDGWSSGSDDDDDDD